ncbi:hypothetical protein E4T56_gene14468 [Termitomyces sp. T112]|nr:hypothetical protein E4T56_gene14468 [Termitomyces sp. T112]
MPQIRKCLSKSQVQWHKCLHDKRQKKIKPVDIVCTLEKDTRRTVFRKKILYASPRSSPGNGLRRESSMSTAYKA